MLGMFDTIEVSVGDETLSVALADSPSERSQGLREVEDLGDLDGMLFAFPEPRAASFGMLNTVLPLDIWWFDESGVLIGSTEMTPCPQAPCVSYASPGPVKWALETPLGAQAFENGSLLSIPD